MEGFVVPSSSLDRDYPGDSSWRRKLDESEWEDQSDFKRAYTKKNLSEFDASASPQPPLSSEPFDEQISRLEKKLKKNLPNEVRLSLESELAALKRQRDQPQCDVSPGNARRKIGSNAPLGDGIDLPTEEVPKKKYYNKAAPVNLHPKTITRMADWQNELDRRIREQEELDKKNRFEKDSSDSSNPLESIQKAMEAVVNSIANVLGIKDEAVKNDDQAMPQDRPVLPPQTFSRRL